MIERRARWPAALSRGQNTRKRGEDVRARLNVILGFPASGSQNDAPALMLRD